MLNSKSSRSKKASATVSVQVSQEQLDQVEYLFQQSERGHHLLFDSQTLQAAFAGQAAQRAVTEKDADEVQEHIQSLITIPSLRGKKLYIEKLDRKTLNRVVRVYFSILENNLYEQRPEARH